MIISIYNSEEYIKRCTESVLRQKYKNLEVILVDYVSTDNSYSICMKYKFIDKRINVIKNNHQGVGRLRNTGLDIARGERIFFLDSDDFIEENTIEKLYNNAIINKIYISMCYFKTFYNKDEIYFAATEDDLKLEEKYSSNILMDWMYKGGHINGLCAIV